MTRRLVGGLAAAMLAVGILTGAAGTIVIRDATTPSADVAAVMADHMDGAVTASMMAGGMMSGSMMDAGPGMMSGPGPSPMPGSLHDRHHPAASQEGAK
jgi:hypothetical protein